VVSAANSDANSPNRLFNPLGKPVLRSSGSYWAAVDRKGDENKMVRFQQTMMIAGASQLPTYFLYARKAASNSKWHAGLATLDELNEIVVLESSFPSLTVTSEPLSSHDALRARLWSAYSTALADDKEAKETGEAKRTTTRAKPPASKFSPTKASTLSQTLPDPRSLRRKAGKAAKVRCHGFVMSLLLQTSEHDNDASSSDESDVELAGKPATRSGGQSKTSKAEQLRLENLLKKKEEEETKRTKMLSDLQAKEKRDKLALDQAENSRKAL